MQVLNPHQNLYEAISSLVFCHSPHLSQVVKQLPSWAIYQLKSKYILVQEPRSVLFQKQIRALKFVGCQAKP